MSLKAYDGLMTLKSFEYVQNETYKRMDKFKELSINQILKEHVNTLIDHVDNGWDMTDSMKFHVINETKLKKEIDDIKTEDITYLSYLYQASKILSTSYFINPYVTHLKLTLEHNGKRLLIYPILCVQGHMNILREYLNDWHGQNQCDSPDNISEDEWEERCKDWYAFSEKQGYKAQIMLYDPNVYMDNVVRFLRGDELVNRILDKLPSKKDRIFKKAKRQLINKNCLKQPKDERISYVINKNEELTNNKQIVYDYIKENNIIVTTIDENFLNSKYKSNK